MTEEGRVGGFGRRCQLSGVTLPSEASRPNITGAWQQRRWGREVDEVRKEGETTQEGTLWCDSRGNIMETEEKLAASSITNLCIYRKWNIIKLQYNLLHSNTKAPQQHYHCEPLVWIRRSVCLKQSSDMACRRPHLKAIVFIHVPNDHTRRGQKACCQSLLLAALHTNTSLISLQELSVSSVCL